MDDPGGPHPRRAPVTWWHRRQQVPWATVFGATERALESAPDWEEVHHLYGIALSLWGWSGDADSLVLQAGADHAWTQVLRWADLAETERPEFWISSRPAARAAALEALGRADEARAVRAAAAQHASSSFRVRFGRDVELVALHLPAEARPGDTITISYAWRAVRPLPADYFASVEFRTKEARRPFGHAHRMGGTFGTSRWPSGERIEEQITVVIPEDTAPGPYRVRVAVSAPGHVQRLRVGDADLPHGERFAMVGTLILTP
jgi:hypothetical protein